MVLSISHTTVFYTCFFRGWWLVVTFDFGLSTTFYYIKIILEWQYYFEFLSKITLFTLSFEGYRRHILLIVEIRMIIVNSCKHEVGVGIEFESYHKASYFCICKHIYWGQQELEVDWASMLLGPLVILLKRARTDMVPIVIQIQ